MENLVDNMNFTLLERSVTNSSISEFYHTILLMCAVSFGNLITMGPSDISVINSYIIGIEIMLLVFVGLVAGTKALVNRPLMKYYQGYIKILSYLGAIFSVVFIVYNIVALFKLI